jgi:hypothetical protein
MKHLTRNNPLSKIYSRILAMALIILALVIINLLATVTAPQQAMRRESRFDATYAPGNPAYEVMRRESDVNRSILVNLPNGNTLVWEV